MTHNEQRVGEAAIFDALAKSGPADRAFLRHRWFAVGNAPSATSFVATDDAGSPCAAFALVERRKGPFVLREVGGCYWPFRGVPVAPRIAASDLSRALARHKNDLGRVWRLGPVETGDASLETLIRASRMAGWQVLSRPLGKVFELDLAALAADDGWPSTKTQRKNRWRKRRLEDDGGPLRTVFFNGADWSADHRDAMARIEAASWLGKLGDGGDTKFRDPAMRRYWEDLCDDRVLAEMLFGSVMWIGDVPAAFTFGIQAGGVRYYIANNYDERFTQFGPGRVLLYEDFARAAAHGTERISWGLGDAGYKSEMGAKAGPDMVDLLFVRGALLAAALRPWWERPV